MVLWNNVAQTGKVFGLFSDSHNNHEYGIRIFHFFSMEVRNMYNNIIFSRELIHF